MRAARLAARAVELLGPVEGPVVLSCPAAARLEGALVARVRTPRSGEVPAAAVVVLLGGPHCPQQRQPLLRALQHALPRGAPLVLIDHNQPRSWGRRVLAVLALAVRGLAPARARYPAARELAALGFAVERLRLAAGERVQLVRARRR